jgi:hypothetical protein
MAAGSAGSAQQLRSSELLLRILMRGVIDADSARNLSIEVGLDADVLNRLIAEGALADDEGLLYVTETGDHRLTEELHGQVAPSEAPALAAFAEQFDVLDLEVKSALTAWQRAIRDGDAEGQVGAVERWLDVDARLRAAAGRTQAPTRILGSCLARLEYARERVLDGDSGQLSGADDSSYHNVWFLMHEMLLRMLRRERKG